MKQFLISCISLFLLSEVLGYWDMGTTTAASVKTDEKIPRLSFFRWRQTQSANLEWWFPWWDWEDLRYRRRLNVVAGISIDFLCLGTAALLNRRALLTSGNYLDPWMNRQRDLRIWALGRGGYEDTPFRYRVWRVTRLVPKSLNPEHWHGPRGLHSPRHDVAVIHSLDQMYISVSSPQRWHYAYRTFLGTKHQVLSNDLWFAGSGFEYLQHIKENYKIFFSRTPKSYIVDCSKYLPKWWGKFICIQNFRHHAGVPNGGGFFDRNTIQGIGCFEIRYNEDRIMVFTDLRYYISLIYVNAHLYPGEYYEYAYTQWSMVPGEMYEGAYWIVNHPFIPWWYVTDDMYPMGKKK